MSEYGYGLWPLVVFNSLLSPGVDLSHNAGRLWTDLIGWKGDPHVRPFHLASAVNFHLTNGAPHAWLISKSGFDEGVDLDSMRTVAIGEPWPRGA